jgi:BirA family biotin operon repressor/biotin-[acetyl-CoA-carboxylase] ligase|tara:strand:- start:88 stop:870 length:783 start_codon:yes stop_codon:yes gene_type:complete
MGPRPVRRQPLSIKVPDGYGLRVLDEVDSTNTEAARLVGQLAGPEWILARRQTNGRGRRGRAWSDPVGNFAASLVLFPKQSPEQIALRSFVAALALYDAFVATTGRSDALALKWPNDVLFNGGKVAGILLETTALLGGGFALTIGFGVNLVHIPQSSRLETRATPPVCVLSETGTALEAEEFLAELAIAYAHHETQFCAYGFSSIRQAWLARAARLGEIITARIGSNEITGRFDTIDETGHLILTTAQGRQAIAAADVFF